MRRRSIHSERGSLILIQLAIFLFAMALTIPFIFGFSSLPGATARRDACFVQAGQKGPDGAPARYSDVDIADADFSKVKDSCGVDVPSPPSPPIIQ